MFERVKSAFWSSISQSQQHLSALGGNVRTRLQEFGANRSADDQAALNQDFAALLRAWGIPTLADVPGVLRDLWFRVLLLVLPVVLCVRRHVKLTRSGRKSASKIDHPLGV